MRVYDRMRLLAVLSFILMILMMSLVAAEDAPATSKVNDPGLQALLDEASKAQVNKPGNLATTVSGTSQKEYGYWAAYGGKVVHFTDINDLDAAKNVPGVTTGSMKKGQKVENGFLITDTGKDQPTKVSDGITTIILPPNSRNPASSQQFDALKALNTEMNGDLGSKPVTLNAAGYYQSGNYRAYIGETAVVQHMTGDDTWDKMTVRNPDGSITKYDCDTKSCKGKTPAALEGEYNSVNTRKDGRTAWVETGRKNPDTGDIDKYRTNIDWDNSVKAYKVTSTGSADKIDRYEELQARQDRESKMTEEEKKAKPEELLSDAEKTELEGLKNDVKVGNDDTPVYTKTGLLGEKQFVMKDGKQVDLNVKDGRLVDEEGTDYGPAEGLKENMITQQGGRMKYIGNILNQWSGLFTNQYSGIMNMFFDDPDPIIELDETMSQMLGGIGGWTSLICKQEMADAEDQGYAFSSSMEGAYAHLEAEKLAMSYFNETPPITKQMYKISAKVDPGSEDRGCDIKFSLYLKGAGDNLYVFRNADGNMTMQTSRKEFSVEAGGSGVFYSGSNILYFDSVVDYGSVCVRFHDIDPEKIGTEGCLIGIEKGDEMCADIVSAGPAALEMEIGDDACGGMATSFIPNCW